MRAIIGRELRSYFNGALGYIFSAVVLLFVGIFTMVYNLKSYLSAFEITLGQMSFVYLIAIPILTMRIIADERRQKTDRLLYSLPMGMTRIVIGKYISLTFWHSQLLSCLYPLILPLYGSQPSECMIQSWFLPTRRGDYFNRAVRIFGYRKPSGSRSYKLCRPACKLLHCRFLT